MIPLLASAKLKQLKIKLFLQENSSKCNERLINFKTSTHCLLKERILPIEQANYFQLNGSSYFFQSLPYSRQ